ncbi:hypothetical protein, partial [Argonema galeatum]|uniref:hypothetical protein n=1 Tax=Argonema galeatum TaxID=2942762 RepID=UPI0020116BB9
MITERNGLAQTIGIAPIPPVTVTPLKPAICLVEPSSLDLTVPPDRRNKIVFSGYDFDSAPIVVLLKNGDQEIDVTEHLTKPSPFERLLNLGGNGVPLSSNSQKFIVRAGGEEISSISIISPSITLSPLMLYWNAQRGDNATVATVAARHSQEQSGYAGPNIQGCVLSDQQPGTIPLLLFWNQQRQDNSTVATPEMIQSQRDSGYGNPAVQGYIYPNQEPGTIPLLLFWNQQRQDNSTVATPEM